MDSSVLPCWSHLNVFPCSATCTFCPPLGSSSRINCHLHGHQVTVTDFVPVDASSPIIHTRCLGRALLRSRLCSVGISLCFATLGLRRMLAGMHVSYPVHTLDRDRFCSLSSLASRLCVSHSGDCRGPRQSMFLLMAVCSFSGPGNPSQEVVGMEIPSDPLWHDISRSGCVLTDE